MKNSLLWRGVMILGILALLAWAAFPLDEKLRLGLDLQGGMHLVLEVQTEDALRAETESDMDVLLRQLKDEGLTGVRGQRTGDTTFVVEGIPEDSFDLVEDVQDDYLGRWSMSRQGDGAVELDLDDRWVQETRVLAVRQASQTISNRVNTFGVTEPVITPQVDQERIIVQLPGVDDPERVKRLIKNTAFLEFRIVDFPEGGGGAASREEILANYGGQVPSNVEIFEGDRLDPVTGEAVGTVYYALERSSAVTGRDLKNARAGLGEFNDPVVNFSLNAEGAEKFGEVTGNNIGRGLAIILDGRVVTAPRINGQIRDSGMIEGGFTRQEVDDLVTTLRSGALPAGIEYLEERTVGPSLGQDSIDQGLEAGLIGGALVVLVMLLFYRLSGVNAVLVLAMNVVLVFGALAYFGATLTLPGIAGIVLTIGMAVDANVLVFERIKEELRKGRTPKAAIDLGFQNARSSIFDANITTLIAAMFLFQFGTGPIRGFAVTLCIGILSSVFTALVVSRWLFDLQMAGRTRVEKLSI